MSQYETEEGAAILNRLKSAQGHLMAVIGMIKVGRPCEEVLHQLDAVGAALSAASCALRACEFGECVDTLAYSPDPEVRIAEVQRLAALWGLPMPHFTSKEKAFNEQTA